MKQNSYSPAKIYASPSDGPLLPRVLQAPPRYIQGPDILQHIGQYLGALGLARFGLLASARGHASQAKVVNHSLASHKLHAVPSTFAGECSLQEINERAAELKPHQIDCLIAVGGGKCVDAGKCIAQRLHVPVVIVPTLASNDAPCSAVSVIYSNDGAKTGVEFFAANPVAVVVDTAVVASADERYLVAGIGDAMATWYEARVCAQNPLGRTVLGARPTITACAMGELCANTLFAHAERAAQSVRDNRVNDSVEDVVEANTLLSGIGFESGGLAAAHGVAMGYTYLAEVEANYLHGEMVSMGLVAQLMLEQDEEQANRVTRFLARVGLPVHLEQIDLSARMDGELRTVVEAAMTFPHLANHPFPVTAQTVHQAIIQADQLGRQVATELGDEAYRRIQGPR